MPLLLLVLLLATPAPAAEAQSGAPSASRLSFAEPPATPEDAVPLPNPGGPFQVGTVTYHWVLDEPEELTDAPSDRRELIAQLFYPARRTRGDVPPSAYVPELPLLRRGLLAFGFPPFAELSERMSSYARVQTAAWPGEPVLESEGPFPVVLISPGGNMSRHWHTALSQELASEGYVVAVMSHARSGMDVFPGAGFTASDRYWHPGDEVPDAEVERRDSLLASRLGRDSRAVLDGLHRLADPGGTGELRGDLDLERVGLIGHSRGGSTVTAACGTDSRFDACVVFDNVGAVAWMEASLSRPRLTARAPWPEERARRLADILSGSGPDAFEAVIRGANHFSFTDLPLVDPEGYPSEGIDPEEAHRIVSRLTIAFLDRYLRGLGPGFLEAADGLADRVELRAY